ncbi:MAG: glycosaminoglycan attachment site [Gammaproteobacteria bacterium]|nr:glycosaminoglycan attachment site [Gammaproteobacteria bacterium]
MELFSDCVPLGRQHQIYRMLKMPENAPERDVLRDWSYGFMDRDGKFVSEFQTTFEACFWELYLYAALKEFGAEVDFSHHAPDFAATVNSCEMTLEATICRPREGAVKPYGAGVPDVPSDLNEMNRDAAIRIANSITSKVSKYRSSYSSLAHVREKPFVICLTSFDRPHPHLSGNRPIFLALYGLYFDEEQSIATGSDSVVRYELDSVEKRKGVDVPMGYFVAPEMPEVSAVIYSPVATWGKVRALANKPDGGSVFVSYHPKEGSLLPEVRKTPKRNYSEHLLDGLYAFHNPFAQYPIGPDVFDHPRIAQMVNCGEDGMRMVGPDDFLLMRHLFHVTHDSDGLREAFKQ